MEAVMVQPTKRCRVVALPYPGRGHINPMLNLCRLIASRRPDILITFVVTEEWLCFLGSESKPASLSFCAIPNVIPSELVRAADFPGFVEAVMTKLEAPVERLLDHLDPPASLLVSDTLLTWVVELGNRRNIPVASFWPMSAIIFSMYYHFDLLLQNGHYPTNLLERRDDEINYIPGVPPTRIADLPTTFHDKNPQVLRRSRNAIQFVSKAQYLLISSIYELEAPIIDALKENFPIPIYPVGPSIPYFQLDNTIELPEYIKWLDAQPKGSVLYISQGSFLSVSSSQFDEIVVGVLDSGVRYFWVARTNLNDSRFRGNDDKGLVVPWCDQLKVLCHPSIGGFWTHCGWNSTKEGVYAGIPMLTFPIMLDQVPNSKRIVRDWKIGWRVRREEVGSQILVTREEIGRLVKRFMDFDDEEGRNMRRRSKEIMMICRQATLEGGSSGINVDAFVEDIMQ